MSAHAKDRCGGSLLLEDALSAAKLAASKFVMCETWLSPKFELTFFFPCKQVALLKINQIQMNREYVHNPDCEN